MGVFRPRGTEGGAVAEAILAGTVLLEIIVVTPGSAKLGFLGSFAAYAGGLVLAWRFAGELD